MAARETIEPRERRLWLTAAAWILVTYSTLYFVRAPVEFLRARGLLGSFVGWVFAAAAVVGLVWLVRRRPRPLELAVWLVFAAGLGAALGLTGRAEEKLHFLQYGILGGLLFGAFRLRGERRSGASTRSGDVTAALQALGLGVLAGWGDEGIQHFLPNRVYDLKDVAWNGIGASIAIAALLAARTVRRPRSR